jgi:dephospho-CoA kinase
VRIGLTGGIGSGKSTVAAQLADLGAVIIDADAIGRELAAPGGLAIPAIASAFGPQLIGPDGGLDRARMRELVFADASQRQRLEAILHPLIRAESERRADAAGERTLVYDVPLLVESLPAWRERLDHILVIDCSITTQIERVMQRSGWRRAAVQADIAQQASREARRAIADAVILNEGLTLDQLRAEVTAIWRRWTTTTA